MSSDATTRPHPDAAMSGAKPQVSVTTTGRPTDIASSTLIGYGSSTEGSTYTLASLIRGIDCAGGSGPS
jgi:hypothetical protein